MSTQYAVAIIKEVSIGWKVTLGEKAVPVLFKGKNDALRFLERLGTGLPKQVFVYRSGQLEEAWFWMRVTAEGFMLLTVAGTLKKAINELASITC